MSHHHRPIQDLLDQSCQVVRVSVSSLLFLHGLSLIGRVRGGSRRPPRIRSRACPGGPPSATLVEKQMRLGPATQAALLSRMLLTAVFRSQAPKCFTEDHCAPALKRVPRSNAKSETRAPVCEFSGSHPALEGEDFGRGRMPGHLIHWTESDFPRRLTLERITGNAEPWSAALQKHTRA
jgi:hypothetical protein